MADPTQSADSRRAVDRRRVAIAFGAITLVGFTTGALANVGIARVLALPEDAEPPQFVDAAPSPDGEGPRGPESVAAGEEAAIEPGEGRLGHGRALPKKTYAETIVRRNIFDSSAVYDPNAGNGADGDCKTSSDVRLLATIVADTPAYSSALISIGGGKDAKAEGYAIGDDLGGEGRITAIEQKKVCTDGGSCLCIGTDKAKAAAGTGEEGKSDGGVTKTGDNQYQVDQSVIDEAMGSFETLAGQIRVVPHKDANGQIDGYRLSAIRRGSLFDKLGIKNGDIVHAVNGSPLTSTEGALSTYQTLKSEKSFNFEITRRNQRQKLEYEVR